MDGGEDFGPWLARQLRRLGMSQAELGQRVGLTRAAVSAWITGRAVPREDMMRRIAEALGTDAGTVHTRTTDTVSVRPVSWYHRPSHADGGREFGNPAAFAFEADVDVLAREATQNSLDERLDRACPVRVRYTLHELSGEPLARFRDAIGWSYLRPHYEAAAAQDQKVGRVIAEGLRDMNERDRLVLLRVDDYNASGLTGDDYEDGRFAAVVRRQLDSHKSDDGAGGSYGLGKATLWATSRLGLVLINSTLSEPHEGRSQRRLIGRLELPWRMVDGETYAGPAWFGEPDTDPGARKNVARSWWADEETVERLHLTRESEEPGTSFLIVGAHDVASGPNDPAGEEADEEESVQTMHRKLVLALADNFWAAMTSGSTTAPLLEASVRSLRNGAVVMKEQRVDPRIARPALTRALKAFFDGQTVDRLTEVGEVAMARVPLKVPAIRGRGKAVVHEAVLLVTAAEDRDGKPNHIVTMRGSRMKVRSVRVSDLPLGAGPFQAVLLAGHAAGQDAAEADRAEAFLRASEPPEHNKWAQTEELRASYSPTAHWRISEFTTAANKAVRAIVGRREERSQEGPKALRELLGLEGAPSAGTKGGGFPVILDLDAFVDDAGAWQIEAEVKLPVRKDPWVMSPVARFEVRSGGRPSVAWSSVVAGDNCRVVDDALHFKAGARTASFTATTDVSTHPVRAVLAGLVVDLQKSKGASE
ncbi:helix-turn-helix transcriptional regulator [Streptomyces sp. NBC_01498]|uniref:helix-turn-helix transcriptional regulator n=1 Tax=Streptomyces sp. NBC_01498 TaxID=2975870 RepID=UPI002E7B1497|nr:helix-turn-helix transcriptional regulator [Streptomyces sp. NBC_01498]WTL26713.1 helix-turn-helix transcriptional regulator [Streptomyces sp. NBC_01498]